MSLILQHIQDNATIKPHQEWCLGDFYNFPILILSDSEREDKNKSLMSFSETSDEMLIVEHFNPRTIIWADFTHDKQDKEYRISLADPNLIPKLIKLAEEII